MTTQANSNAHDNELIDKPTWLEEAMPWLSLVGLALAAALVCAGIFEAMSLHTP